MVVELRNFFRNHLKHTRRFYGTYFFGKSANSRIVYAWGTFLRIGSIKIIQKRQWKIIKKLQSLNVNNIYIKLCLQSLINNNIYIILCLQLAIIFILYYVYSPLMAILFILYYVYNPLMAIIFILYNNKKLIKQM